MGLLDWLRRPAKKPHPSGSVAIVPPAPSSEDQRIDALLAEGRRTGISSGSSIWLRVPELETVKEWAALEREEQARLVWAMIARLVDLDERAASIRATSPHGVNIHQDKRWSAVWDPRMTIFEAMKLLLRRKLPLEPGARRALLTWCAGSSGLWTACYPVTTATEAAEQLVAAEGLTSENQRLLERYLRALRGLPQCEKELRKSIDRTEELLGRAPELPIEAGEAWSEAARAEFSKMAAPARAAWLALLGVARSAASPAPTTKWTKLANQALAEVGREDFQTDVGRWFALAEKRRTIPALSNRQWRQRCAQVELSRNYLRLTEAFGNRQGFWSVYAEIQRDMAQAGDAWHYLRTLAIQDAVRKNHWQHAPAWPVPAEPPAYDPIEDQLISEANMDILRGLAWMCGLVATPEVARAVRALALSAYRKVPGKGPRAVRVGNACITALGMMGGQHAVGQLALLKVKVKFGTAQAQIEKALTIAAEKAGVPREELEEMSVPAYGLTEVGRLTEPLGGFTAELTVRGRGADLIWRHADGKPQKSLPTEVKKEFAGELKELNAARKDIEKMLPAQAERLDSMFLQQKTWPLETWLERYLEHPLVGTLTRRLIWNFTADGTTTPGLWLDGKLVNRLGHPVPLDAARTTVALWHPLDQPPDVVLGWRAFLEEWQIVQPFKQAHREVYLLTPAEERTRTYSNRFAAHVLKQHQFHALCAARGWKNKLRLLVDDTYPPATRLLPRWGVRAEFWIEGAGDHHGTDTNESGTFLYVATDQVRFYRLDDGQLTAHAGGGGYGVGWQQQSIAEPLPLADIPPLVFSEIMRDVDLFVGVASVGNDPAWADGGRRETERDAWNLHAFGDLSATAQTRRDLLQRLVPKLKIADRCSFAEKFLVVRGDLRTYKIHLGSGNILMSPNDRYLCIVPGHGKAENGKVFLPFEGDRTLSVILSKAFLLAADTKITDSSITQQIRHL